MEFVPRHRLHDNRLFKAYQQRHFGAGLRAGRLITKHLCCEVPLLIAPTRTVAHFTKNWIYSHLLMSKYDANAVQMCGKHGKCRIYSHIYNPYVKVK